MRLLFRMETKSLTTSPTQRSDGLRCDRSINEKLQSYWCRYVGHRNSWISTPGNLNMYDVGKVIDPTVLEKETKQEEDGETIVTEKRKNIISIFVIGNDLLLVEHPSRTLTSGVPNPFGPVGTQLPI